MKNGLKNYGKWVETSVEELYNSGIDLRKIPKNEVKKLQKICKRMIKEKTELGLNMGELDLAKAVIERGNFKDKDGNTITFEDVQKYAERMTLMDGLKIIAPNVDWENKLPKSNLVKNTEDLYRIDKDLAYCKQILERKGLWGNGIQHIQHIGVPSAQLLFSNENRPIDMQFIERLFNSILNTGFNSNCRMIINTSREIVDGQHRSLVLFLLGLPYYYIVDDNISFETTDKWNTVCQKSSPLNTVLQMAVNGNAVAKGYKCIIDIMSDNFEDVTFIDGDMFDGNKSEQHENYDVISKKSIKVKNNNPNVRTLADKILNTSLLLYVDKSKLGFRKEGDTKNLYTRYSINNVLTACNYYDSLESETEKKEFFDVNNFIQNCIPRVSIFSYWMKMNYLPKVQKNFALTPLQNFRKDDFEVALLKLWLTDTLTYDELFVKFMEEYVIPNNHDKLIDGIFRRRIDYQSGKYNITFVEDESSDYCNEDGVYGYEYLTDVPHIDIGKSEADFIIKTAEYICGDDLDRNISIRKKYREMYDVKTI